LGSPIKAFVREECELEAVAEVSCSEVFARWQIFCRQSGREHPGTAQSFSRDLHAAVPVLQVKQHRTKNGRVRYYVGVKLRERPVDGT
jgi:phage/plasmid-associated DNA primase